MSHCTQQLPCSTRHCFIDTLAQIQSDFDLKPHQIAVLSKYHNKPCVYILLLYDQSFRPLYVAVNVERPFAIEVQRLNNSASFRLYQQFVERLGQLIKPSDQIFVARQQFTPEPNQIYYSPLSFSDLFSHVRSANNDFDRDICTELTFMLVNRMKNAKEEVFWNDQFVNQFIQLLQHLLTYSPEDTVMFQLAAQLLQQVANFSDPQALMQRAQMQKANWIRNKLTRWYENDDTTAEPIQINLSTRRREDWKEIASRLEERHAWFTLYSCLIRCSGSRSYNQPNNHETFET